MAVRANRHRLKTYLEDPFLARLYAAIRSAPALRSISVDLTHVCNIRCRGCYFFAEGMDTHGHAPAGGDDAAFAELVDREQARGTNFVTIVGGEPSLALDRLAVLHRHFRVNVATNGLRRIPFDGFETMPIGVSVWGNHATDTRLRGSGRVRVFERALANYAGDPRAFFYYTVAPGHAHEVASVVDRCVENGNRVLFNFYSDVEGHGGELDARRGFERVQSAVEAAIRRHPGHVLTTAYFSRVVTTGRLHGERWGYDTCTSVTADHPVNRARIRNGRPFNPHFRAYNADFETTRRCCTGVDRDCATCFDTWEHFSWVMLNMRTHLVTKRAFTDWLTTTYLFHLINRIVDVDEGLSLLPEIHRRTAGPDSCEPFFGRRDAWSPRPTSSSTARA